MMKTMQRAFALCVVIATTLFITMTASAQPIPQGGLRFVNHDGTLTGSGTSPSPLSVVCEGGGGLICSSTNGLSVDTTVVPYGSGTVNYIPLWTPNGNTLGNSILNQPTGSGVQLNGDYFAIHDAAARLRLVATAGVNYIQSGVDATAGSSAPLVFSNMNYGAEWARFDTSGNFGIGGAPVAKLDVRGPVVLQVPGGSTPVAPLSTATAKSGLEVNLDVNSLITFGDEGNAPLGNPAITMYRTSSGFRTGTAYRLRTDGLNATFQHGTYNVDYGTETYTPRWTVLNGSGFRVNYDSTYFFDILPKGNHDTQFVWSNYGTNGALYIGNYGGTDYSQFNTYGGFAVVTQRSDYAGVFYNTPVAATVGHGGVHAVSQGTYDTSGGVVQYSAVNAYAIASRSAGSSNLWGIGLFASAYNGQINQSIRTGHGDVILNSESGYTQILQWNPGSVPALQVWDPVGSSIGGWRQEGPAIRIGGYSGVVSTMALGPTGLSATPELNITTTLSTFRTSINSTVDDTFLTWDAGQARLGITKKAGSVAKATYGSANDYCIAQSSGLGIEAANTFTDRFCVLSNGGLSVQGDYTYTGSFTPTTVGWYRIIDAGTSVSGIIRVQAAYDNKTTDVEFHFNVNGWGAIGSIQQVRHTDYNNGVVEFARITTDGSNAVSVDIYIGSATTPGPVKVWTYGPHTSSLVSPIVVGAVARPGNTQVLTLGHGFRTTKHLVAQGNGSIGHEVVTNAKFGVKSGNSSAGLGSAPGTGAWGDGNWSIFGPNVESANGAALGLGYDTTNDVSTIVSLAPSVGWKGMWFNAESYRWYQGGSERMRLGGDQTLRMYANGGGEQLSINYDLSGAPTAVRLAGDYYYDWLVENGTQSRFQFYNDTSNTTMEIWNNSATYVANVAIEGTLSNNGCTFWENAGLRCANSFDDTDSRLYLQYYNPANGVQIGDGVTESWLSLEKGYVFVGRSNAPSFIAYDLRTQAQGVGGSVQFDGNYTGTTRTTAALINAAKTNSVDGNYSFDLEFWARTHGGGLQKGLIVKDNGQVQAYTVGQGGQTTADLTDAGNRAGLMWVGNSGTAFGAGGGIVFGNGQSELAGSIGMAAIKAFLENGAGNTSGGIKFSTRRLITDTNLTEAMSIAGAGHVTINQNLNVGGCSYMESGGTRCLNSFYDSDSALYLQTYNPGAGLVVGDNLTAVPMRVYGSLHVSFLDASSGIYLGTTAGDSPKVGWRVSDNSERFRAHLLGVNTAAERIAFIKTVAGEGEIMNIKANNTVNVGGPVTETYMVNARGLFASSVGGGSPAGLFIRQDGIAGWHFYNPGSVNYMDLYSENAGVVARTSYGTGALMIGNGIGREARGNFEVAGSGTQNVVMYVGGQYSGPTSGYTGNDQETSRNTIIFPSWRDVVANTAGAKIVGVNKTAFVGPNWYYVQNTDLAFFTLGTTPGDDDDTTEKMRIFSTGAVALYGNNYPNARFIFGATGTLTANGTTGSANQVLAIVSGVPQWTTMSTISGVTGTGNFNYLPVFSTNPTGSTIANSIVRQYITGNFNMLHMDGVNSHTTGIRLRADNGTDVDFDISLQTENGLWGTPGMWWGDNTNFGNPFMFITPTQFNHFGDGDFGGYVKASVVHGDTQLHDYVRGFEFFDEFMSNPVHFVWATDFNSYEIDNSSSWVGGGGVGGYYVDEADRPGVIELVAVAQQVIIGCPTVATCFWPGAGRIIQGTYDNTNGPIGNGWFAGAGELWGAIGFKLPGTGYNPTLPLDTTDSAVFHVGMFDHVVFATGTSDYADNGTYCRAGNGSTNWQGCACEGGTCSCADTSPTIAIAYDKWMKCEWYVNAAGTEVTITVYNITDGTSGSTTRTTNIPNDNTHPVGMGIDVTKVSTDGTAENGDGFGTIWVDYAWSKRFDLNDANR